MNDTVYTGINITFQQKYYCIWNACCICRNVHADLHNCI